jgi:cytochrome oxidase assembly protein ShyY1
LVLLLVVLVVCAGFGWLGSWQLGVAKHRGEQQALREARSQTRVPIDEVLVPQQSFSAKADGRRVSAQGTFDPAKQVLVTGRVQPGGDGSVGWWVVGALRTTAGAWLPVVRGWVPRPDNPAASPASAPSGTVTVEGVLQPDEPAGGAAVLPEGQLATIDVAELVNRWGTPIYNGFLVATGQHADVPSEAPQPAPVPPPQPQPEGIAWRNAAYAVQWWVFAAFALVMWGKMVQQAARDEAVAATGDESDQEEAEREHSAT